MNKILSVENMMSSFPYALTTSNNMIALAKAASEELVKLYQDNDLLAIYTNIDQLDEALLDILAYDFKVDWYEFAAPVENKRQAIKECILVHKRKGTKYALEIALHSMFQDAKVEEWFEYGGQPYHFKLTVYGGSSGGGLRNLYLKMQYAKNLRSVMDDATFIIIPDNTADIFAGTKGAGQVKRIGAKILYHDESVFTVTATLHTATIRCAATKRLYVKITHSGN